MGTFIDPNQSGGKLNSRTTEDIVEYVKILEEDYLIYKALPINVAIIRASTGDSEGNLSFERESLYSDARQIAMAARSSGGICIAQVERLAEVGSIAQRNVHVPGAFVDCVVPAEETEDSYMSFFTEYNPSWSGEIREPLDTPQPWPLDTRKVIARRAALELKLDDVVNLGIGMPEGIATVAREERIFQYVTLTTEGGVFGGVGASGHEFGPASCPSSIQEINQQFDFYNGGGLDICFLGLAQCSSSGEVNVSRLTDNHLTGPGGFIDITQCTKTVVFMGTFRKRGLQINLKKIHEGAGANESVTLEIENEGEFPTFIPNVREITFSSDMALKCNQKVLYVTERAVFQLSSEGIELLEVAPGIDIEKDVVSKMEFKPIVRPEKVKLMDPRIFQDERMKLFDDFFSLEKALQQRVQFKKETNTLYLDLSGFYVNNEETVDESFMLFKEVLDSLTSNGKSKVNLVVNYDGFDIRDEVEEKWFYLSQIYQKKYYKTVSRIMGMLFFVLIDNLLTNFVLYRESFSSS